MQRSILAFVLLVAVDSRILQHEDCCLWHGLKKSALEFDEERALLNSKDIQYCLCEQGMAGGYPSIYNIPSSYNASDRSNISNHWKVINQRAHLVHVSLPPRLLRPLQLHLPLPELHLRPLRLCQLWLPPALMSWLPLSCP